MPAIIAIINGNKTINPTTTVIAYKIQLRLLIKRDNVKVVYNVASHQQNSALRDPNILSGEIVTESINNKHLCCASILVDSFTALAHMICLGQLIACHHSLVYMMSHSSRHSTSD
ncbi:2694_t:CDS:2 [Ambispora leptoticha]|uniref:2694_t:CDS:1 n=1 Tax=Ambispora leptoticha TaxID=144679 RepID=A0A9N9F2G2_9GLOM|nr:2694_t:CDS:2 [Ambispora leptoticha]